MQLLRVTESTFLSKYGTSDGGKHILDKMRTLDYSKFLVNELSKNFLIGMIDRKISSDTKTEILSLLSNGTIELFLADQNDGVPQYLFTIPQPTPNGKLKIMLNIGYYAKFKKESGEVLDIDPRILFCLLTYAYGQYKIYINPAKIQDIKIQDIILSSYKKIMNRIIGKIVNLNILTNEEKMLYDVIISAYISKVLLRKDDRTAEVYVKTSLTKLSTNKDKLENAISSVEFSQINSFEDFIKLLLDKCPSFKKISVALILREYTISMKSTAVLSLDIIQILIPTLLSINVGSSGIFADKFVENVLDGNELSLLKVNMARGL